MSLSRLDLLIVAVSIVLILLLTSAENELPTEYGTAVEVALDALGEDDTGKRTTRGWIELASNGQSVSAARLVRILPRSLDRHPVPVIASIGPERSAVGLARGVDRNYHVWQSFLEGYVPFQPDNIWVPLLILAKRKTYMLDHDLYSLATDADIWQTSREAFRLRHGDCEDHAVLLADWLIGLGEQARVAVGTLDGGGHAWVVLFRNGKEYVLEATQKHGVSGLRSYPLARTKPGYQPRYQFDREHFWVNTQRGPTTRYNDQRWQLRSRFRL